MFPARSKRNGAFAVARKVREGRSNASTGTGASSSGIVVEKTAGAKQAVNAGVALKGGSRPVFDNHAYEGSAGPVAPSLGDHAHRRSTISDDYVTLSVADSAVGIMTSSASRRSSDGTDFGSGRGRRDTDFGSENSSGSENSGLPALAADSANTTGGTNTSDTTDTTSMQLILTDSVSAAGSMSSRSSRSSDGDAGKETVNGGSGLQLSI